MHYLKSYCNKIFREMIIDNTVIVGVSWGADSMLLLYLLYNYSTNIKIIVVHCNHKTREDCDQESLIVKKFSKKLGCIHKKYEYTWQKFDENSLRYRRHKCFCATAKIYDSQEIFLGHHLDDRIETSILNMNAWTDIKWLQSIKKTTPHFLNKNLSIKRPFLDISKQKILDLCAIYHIPFIHDKSNEDPQTSQRNAIRYNLLKSWKSYSTKQRKSNEYQLYNSRRNLFHIIDNNIKADIELVPISHAFPHISNLFRLFSYASPDIIARVCKNIGITDRPRSTTYDIISDFCNAQNPHHWYKYYKNRYFRKTHGNIFVFQSFANNIMNNPDKGEQINNKLHHQINNLYNRSISEPLFRYKKKMKLQKLLPTFARERVTVTKNGDKQYPILINYN